MSIQKILDRVTDSVKEHPMILAVCGCVGVVVTAVVAAKAGIKQESMLRDEAITTLTNEEVRKKVVVNYIPTAVSAAITVFCILGSGYLSNKQQIALLAAYSTLKNGFKQYRSKNIEIFGKENDDKVVEACLAADRVQEGGVRELWPYTCDLPDEGELLFYTDECGYFAMTKLKVLEAEHHLNRMIQLRGDFTLKEWYEFLGVEPKNCVIDEKLGWSYDTLLEWYDACFLDIFHQKHKNDEGVEYYTFEYMVNPMDIYEAAELA